MFYLRSRLRRAASGWGCVSRRLPATPRTWPRRLRSRSAVFPLTLPPTADADRDDNSFPWVGDFDGDGKLDLLVGQHGRGKGREG